jgi:hypothetical protein
MDKLTIKRIDDPEILAKVTGSVGTGKQMNGIEHFISNILYEFYSIIECLRLMRDLKDFKGTEKWID